jgi:5'-3' exonuclease
MILSKVFICRVGISYAYVFDNLEEASTIRQHWLEEYNPNKLCEAVQGLPTGQLARQIALVYSPLIQELIRFFRILSIPDSVT